ncbi:MAG: OB-fold nucleic acid binding domain-containing protein [Candidatus Njordarchaeales archaeon]
MKIRDLKIGLGKVNIIARVVKVEEPRVFVRDNKEGRVTEALIRDSTGEFKLTLWDEEVDKVKEGMKIKIENGYVNEFQGEPRLSAGRYGKLTIIK